MKKIKIGNIKLIAYDFDGVMTDNRVLVDQDGKEAVFANRTDGMAVSRIKAKGIRQIIISTETNNVVKMRGKKLKIDVISGCIDKLKGLSAFCRRHKIGLKEILFVGNDVNDLEVMQNVNYRVCPADANLKIKRISDIVTKSKGGEGVVRELAEKLGLL